MAITDELRSGVANYPFRDNRDFALFEGIADRIDEKHRKAMDDSYRDGYQEGKRDGDDEWYEEHESYLEEHGWYQALDADKEPIKFGDEVEHNGVRANVLGITFHGTTPPTVCIVRGDCWVEADELHHVKQPTVEDVLHSFICDVEEDVRDEREIIAEYAAKLRLADDGKEQ